MGKISTNKAVAKSAGIIGLATLCSRILGFARDVVIARLFGVYEYSQAFVIAFRIPNLFRDIVGEGATNAAFVPVFSEYAARRQKQEFWELAAVVLNLLLVALAAVVLLGILFSPFIVRLIAPGFVQDTAKFALTVKLNRLLFPYLLLIGLTAYSVAVLNSLKHFAVPAFAPCLLNISIITCLLVLGEGVKGLAAGVLLGGALQLAVQIPLLYKKGFRFGFLKHRRNSHAGRGFTGNFKHPETKTIARLLAPRVFSTCVYQLNNFVDSIFGSLGFIVGEGGVAVLYFAYRIIQFPLGVFSSAISQALLPELSLQALDKDYARLKHSLLFGLRAVFFVLLPASIGLMIFSRTIISALFEGGRFDRYSTDATARALFFYSVGLCAFGAAKVLGAGFFALKNTRTPAKISMFSLVLNIALNALLIFPLKISGVALATSISGIISGLTMFYILQKKLGGFSLSEVGEPFVRILAASLGMGLVCYFISGISLFSGSRFFLRIANLGFLIAAAAVCYAGFCFIFRVKELNQFRRFFTGWILGKGRYA